MTTQPTTTPPQENSFAPEGGSRRCPRCGRWQDNTEANFYRNPRTGRLTTPCRRCKCAYSAERHAGGKPAAEAEYKPRRQTYREGDMRPCSRYGQEKPWTEDNFYRDPGRGVLVTVCRPCRAEVMADWQDKQRAQRAAEQAARAEREKPEPGAPDRRSWSLGEALADSRASQRVKRGWAALDARLRLGDPVWDFEHVHSREAQ